MRHHLTNIRSYSKTAYTADPHAQASWKVLWTEVRAEQAERHTAGMVIIGVCVVVVLAGLVAVVRWG
ncbi:MAG: hypothetical protein M3O65_00195, partial [Actinomycetota bacterium]|nr:hypothetical protein [Actinomycetota bacterium]